MGDESASGQVDAFLAKLEECRPFLESLGVEVWFVIPGNINLTADDVRSMVNDPIAGRARFIYGITKDRYIELQQHEWRCEGRTTKGKRCKNPPRGYWTQMLGGNPDRMPSQLSVDLNDDINRFCMTHLGYR